MCCNNRSSQQNNLHIAIIIRVLEYVRLANRYEYSSARILYLGLRFIVTDGYLLIVKNFDISIVPYLYLAWDGLIFLVPMPVDGCPSVAGLAVCPTLPLAVC